jgi:hypothetical protein
MPPVPRPTSWTQKKGESDPSLVAAVQEQNDHRRDDKQRAVREPSAVGVPGVAEEAIPNEQAAADPKREDLRQRAEAEPPVALGPRAPGDDGELDDESREEEGRDDESSDAPPCDRRRDREREIERRERVAEGGGDRDGGARAEGEGSLRLPQKRPEARVEQVEVEIRRIRQKLGSGNGKQEHGRRQREPRRARAHDLRAGEVDEARDRRDHRRGADGHAGGGILDGKRGDDPCDQPRNGVDVAAVLVEERPLEAPDRAAQEHLPVLGPEAVPDRHAALPLEVEERPCAKRSQRTPDRDCTVELQSMMRRDA